MKARKINEFFGGWGPPMIEEIMMDLGIRPEYPESQEEYDSMNPEEMGRRAFRDYQDPEYPEMQEDIKELYFWYKGLKKYFEDE